MTCQTDLFRVCEVTNQTHFEQANCVISNDFYNTLNYIIFIGWNLTTFFDVYFMLQWILFINFNTKPTISICYYLHSYSFHRVKEACGTITMLESIPREPFLVHSLWNCCICNCGFLLVNIMICILWLYKNNKNRSEENVVIANQ